MQKLVLLLCTLALVQCGSGATIQGKLFDWETLDPIEHAIIDVNSVPPQRIVAEAGNYSFIVPEGVYKLTAMSFINGELAGIARETIIVESDGIFTVDLVLRAATESDLEEIHGKGFEAELFEGGNENEAMWVLLIVAAGATVTLYIYMRMKKKEPQEEKEENAQELDKYAKEVLAVLQRSGNRLTQKELREKCAICGEAKISLILSELEAMGKIKKIKKGRGNIIVLK